VSARLNNKDSSFYPHRVVVLISPASYSKPSISAVNWFLKNATDKEMADTEVLNPVLK
jgi:hypothetical protein